jgi:hypothetical protein
MDQVGDRLRLAHRHRGHRRPRRMGMGSVQGQGGERHPVCARRLRRKRLHAGHGLWSGHCPELGLLEDTPPITSATWRSGATASRPTPSSKPTPRSRLISWSSASRPGCRSIAGTRDAHRVEDHSQRPVGARGVALPGRQRRVQDDGGHHGHPRPGSPHRLGMGSHPGRASDPCGDRCQGIARPPSTPCPISSRSSRPPHHFERAARGGDRADQGADPDYLQEEIKVEELFYDEPSYTGFVFPVSKFYPPGCWMTTHPLCRRGRNHRGAVGREA